MTNKQSVFNNMLTKRNNISLFLFIIIGSILLSNRALLAQDYGSIKGKITDKTSGEELIGTNVYLKGTGYGAATDYNGNFRIQNIPIGEYTLQASYIGYQDQEFEVIIASGQTIEINIELIYGGSTELEEVTVTAQARGQMNAINEQLSSLSIKNVVSAEKLQELPDANAAESVGRLPGVSVLRAGGEGNKVVIRGLSPKYNKVTIEGVSISAAGQDRSTDISMVSPYSLNGIELLKAATADHDADFIGGTVNFKLREADPGWKYDIIVQGGYNKLKTTYSDYILNGSISNRFFENELGVYFQGNIEKRNRSSNQLSAEYKVENDAVIGENNPLFIQKLLLTDAIRERSRLGATLVLDYKLNDGVIHFKNFYNTSITTTERYNEIFNPVNNRTHSYESSDEEYALNTLSNIIDYEQKIGNLIINAKLSHSNSQNTSPGNLWFQFNQRGALAANVQDDAISPSEIYNFANINDTSTTLDYAKKTTEETKEQQYETSLDIQYDFSLTKQINGNIKIGGKYRYKDRSYDIDAYGSDLFIGSSAPTNNVLINSFEEFQNLKPGQRIPFYLVGESFDHMGYLEGEYSMGSVANLNWIHRIWDVLETTGYLNNYGYIQQERTSYSFDYSGTENFNAAYVMSEINIGSLVRFFPGVRYERNKTTYTGVKGTTNIAYIEQYYKYNDTTVTRSNDYFLPMIHLRINPYEWFDIRLAYTQTLSRPDYNLIVPRRDIYVGDIVFWNNYRLEPEQSENFDIYFSFHQNHIGLFTVGLFSKNIKNMIFNLGQRTITDPSQYDLGDEFKFDRIYTYANNQYEANVKGIELDWQTNFWYLPGALKGLVLNINYTHITSEAKYPFTEVKNIASGPLDPPIWTNIDSFYTSQLIDQPDDIVNIQVGYDYEGFSTRLSMLYQSKIFKKAEFWPEESHYADEYLRWDFTVKQMLPWCGIQLFLNLSNISGALERDLVKGAQWDASIQHYGMTADLGLRIKM